MGQAFYHDVATREPIKVRKHVAALLNDLLGASCLLLRLGDGLVLLTAPGHAAVDRIAGMETAMV